MFDATIQTETILCHCLQVSYAEVQTAIEIYGCATVRDVARQTGAGSGCTCCHQCIRELLSARQVREMQAVA
jgi:NAD(P)H-nitrite reductase large subunit